jgi:hypothetical protein
MLGVRLEVGHRVGDTEDFTTVGLFLMSKNFCADWSLLNYVLDSWITMEIN